MPRMNPLSSLVYQGGKLQRRRYGAASAKKALTWAAKHNGRDWKLWSQAASALEAAEDERAGEAYEQAVRLSAGSDARLLYRYGRYLEKAEQYQQALECFEKAESLGWRRGHMAFRQARCLEALGDTLGAAAAFKRAAADDFDPKQCYDELSRLQGTQTAKWLRLELHREGQQFFEPGDHWSLVHARLSADMGYPEEASSLFAGYAEVQQLGSADVLVYVESLTKIQRSDKAREVLDEAVLRLPAKDRRLGAGVLYQKHGYWDAARDEYARALEADPFNSELYYRIGLTYDREYRWEEAEEHFETAYSRRPSAGYWAYKAGHACERAGRFQKAVDWYRTALTQEPDRHHWWYRLGTSLAELNQPEMAFKALLLSTMPRPQDGLSSTLESPGHLVSSTAPATASPFDGLVTEWGNAATAAGPWNFRSTGDLLSLAELSVVRGLSAEAVDLVRRPYALRTGLSSQHRHRLAEVLNDAERRIESVEVLKASRSVRLPDGFDIDKYLPKTGARRGRLYAEFYDKLPLDESVVLLESNHGATCGCHPLAVFRRMAQDDRFKGKTFIWALNDTDAAPQDVRDHPRVQFVKVGSDDYLMHLATAGYLINNVSFPPYFVRRDQQRYLNTWHGTPMKTLGRSMHQGLVEYENLERNFIQASHIMAPNDLTKWSLIDEHQLQGIYPGCVSILGSPRLDNLVNNGDKLRTDIRNRLGVSEHEKFVLVAPTWRGGVSSNSLDAEGLVEELDALSCLAGTRVFYRAHRLTEKFVKDLDLSAEAVPSDIDTNDLLAAVDHLVSDYSSITFDYLVTGRPVTLYVPDLEEYSSERGLYLQPSEMPASVARTLDQLVESIQLGGDVDESVYREAVQKYAPYEDGRASERCVDFLLSDDKRGAELDGKPTILFHGSMIPNGIASSLLGILTALSDRDDLHVAMLVEPMVLRKAKDRQEIFERLPANVRLISRLGDLVLTPEEHYVRSLVEGGRCNPGEDMLRIYWQGWAREARRIVGDIPITTGVEWDGYAIQWAAIMSKIGNSSTKHLIWQHNDMAREQADKYPELHKVFSVYSKFDAVVSVSKLLAATNKSRLNESYELPEEGIISVQNSVLFDDVREKAQRDMDPELENLLAGANPLVVTIGRMSVEKNQQALLDAWPTVLKEFPEAKLAIVGTGPLQNAIEASVVQANLQSSVVLTGQVSNPYPLLNRADLFVLPSLHEGQPVVLFEAMALDIPVAASDCPGSLEAMDIGYGKSISSSSEKLGNEICHLLTCSEEAEGNFDVSKYSVDAVNQFVLVADIARSQ